MEAFKMLRFQSTILSLLRSLQGRHCTKPTHDTHMAGNLRYIMKPPQGQGLHEAPKDAVLLLGTKRALA